MLRSLGTSQTMVHNDTQHLYGVYKNILNLVAPRRFDVTMTK